MINIPQPVSRLLSLVTEHLDIPKSYYEKARSRHLSLGEWLRRKDSTLLAFSPDIRPQGSFRYGTVNRPLHEDEVYDLDNVCLLRDLKKTSMTQEELKNLYGAEVKAYAKANGMLAPVEEHNRCWRLPYSDEVQFHLDTLPCVPEDPSVVSRLIAAGVPADLASRSIGITDRKNQFYKTVSQFWPSSNPRGFAAFFEARAALGRVRTFQEGLRATVEDVPAYEWKTPLQRSIQILKRHRDVMFFKKPELAPISMIITNLAAQAYEGEADLEIALKLIIEKMPSLVRRDVPRIPNPADPAEDYADKWKRDPRLEESFWTWQMAVKTDIARLNESVRRGTVDADVTKMFMIGLTETELRQFEINDRSPAIAVPTAAQVISYAPKPWGV